MPLTVLEINAAKPGLRPVKQRVNGEKEQKVKKKKGKQDKQAPSKGEVLVEGGYPTGNEDSGFVKADKPNKMADGGGLYLEVDPSGGKYWRFKYGFPKEKRISCLHATITFVSFPSRRPPASDLASKPWIGCNTR
jgi:hypothetical protein